MDLTLRRTGLVRMNLPYHSGSYDHDGYGLTAGAYVLGGDLIHLNARADLVLAQRRF